MNIFNLFNAYHFTILALSPQHLSIDDIISVQWNKNSRPKFYKVQPDCETLHETTNADEVSVFLWNVVKSEINFASDFNLTEEMKLEADKLLLILKRGIFKSNDEQQALRLVFQYNHSVNELVAPLFKQNHLT